MLTTAIVAMVPIAIATEFSSIPFLLWRAEILGQGSCEEGTVGTPGTWPALALCALGQAGLSAEWNYNWSVAVQNMYVGEVIRKLTNISLIPRPLSTVSISC